MANCSVRWRPSGGRGEFEFVPADALEDREINVFIEALGLTVPAEVRGVKAQGKPRLRKFDKDNRQKLHLPQLVMAIARMPEPAREDLTQTISFPLENKAYIMDAMDFEIIEDDGITISLAPLRMSILHSTFQVNLQDRFDAIAKDLESLPKINESHPLLAAAIKHHGDLVRAQVNTAEIRKAADEVIRQQAEIFGMSNAASAVALEAASALPETDLEEPLTGKEGRILTRLHAYKERDRGFSIKVKQHYKKKGGGRLVCQGCDMDPTEVYGADGERCIEAHHTVPIEELQPDSITLVEEMAVICASCHRIVHSRKPCLTMDELRALLAANAKVDPA